MKKLLILIAFPIITNGQESKTEQSKKNISVGVSFSPDYNYRTLRNNDGSSTSDVVIDNRNQNEKGKFGYTTGINLNIKVSEKLEIQTGLFYSNKGFKEPKRAISFAVPEPWHPTHVKSKTNFNYLDIPVKLNFISGKGKMKFIAGAGLAANFLLSESHPITFFYDDGSKRELDQSSGFDFNKFNLSLLISAGAEFKLTEHIFLRAEPTFRYGLLKIIDQPVTSKLWNMGLSAGVYYNLK